MSRIRAFAIHLSLSATAVTLFLLLVFFWMYPHPYYLTENISHLIMILVGVDVILGPAMTLYLFKPGKKGLYFDLTFIALVQVAAFVYGAWTITMGRPQYLAFVVDRFQVVTAREVDSAELRDKSLNNPFGRGPRVVYAAMPEDSEISQQILFDSVLGGKDLEQYPAYYTPYPGPNMDKIAARSLDLGPLLLAQPHGKALVEAALQAQGVTGEAVLWLPLVGKSHDMLQMVSRQDGRFLSVVDINPWITRKELPKMAEEKDEAFLTENAKKPGVVSTPSGLQYRVLQMGDGPKPGASDVVEVHYRGTLPDGVVFDSSYERGAPIRFPLSGVIAGWTEGVQLMPVGSRFEFVIPSRLAYGQRGAPPLIGPGRTLVFEVELLAVGG